MAGKKRKKKAGVPPYGMVPFAGSRQPAGPAPSDLEVLRTEGLLLDDDSEDWRPDCVVETEPSTVEDSAPPEREAAQPGAETVVDTREGPAEKGAEKAQADSKSKPRARRARRARRADYTLPPKRPKGQKSRSCHFRLPGEIDGILTELAEHHDCSRTHVVCSTILAEWQRLQRALARAGKRGQAPRGGSGG